MAAKKEATTMSVPQMRELLGIKKTESYWLVHKQCFETVMIAGRMRIVIESFEKWYANQTHYHKVDGSIPGLELSKHSYTLREIADMFGITVDSTYELIQRLHLPIVTFEQKWRIDADAFEKWYASQKRYRKKEQREQEQPLVDASMTIPEFGREIGLDRREAYKLVRRLKNELELITIGVQKRVTKESFEKWYASQSVYKRFSEKTLHEQRQILSEIDAKKTMMELHKIKLPPEKPSYTVKEVALLISVCEYDVYRLINNDELPSVKIGSQIRVMRRDLLKWMAQKSSDPTTMMEEN